MEKNVMELAQLEIPSEGRYPEYRGLSKYISWAVFKQTSWQDGPPLMITLPLAALSATGRDGGWW
jgi:hypothetical protein